jgi:hypothetical protein
VYGGTKMKFTRIPLEVEAMQFTGDNGYKIEKWSNKKVFAKDNQIKIKTLEGQMTGVVGDWIIKGVKGEFYPCKNEIFKKIYRPSLNDKSKFEKIKKIILSEIEMLVGSNYSISPEEFANELAKKIVEEVHNGI